MLPEYLLQDRVALVTGAGQGIGEATARLMARAGARVVIAELNDSAGEGVARSIQSEGGQAEAVVTDVSDAAQVQSAVDRILRRHGRIDVLVNNAGYYKLVPTLEMDDQAMDRMMAVNYKGVQNCSKAVLPSMIERGTGSIVNLASVAGIMGTWSNTSHYAASKGAVIALTRSFAREFAPKGVRVNAVAPGQIDTQMSRYRLAIEPDFLERTAAAVPLRRLGQPIDVARAILFLASDAAGYINGQVLQVCGGILMA